MSEKKGKRASDAAANKKKATVANTKVEAKKGDLKVAAANKGEVVKADAAKASGKQADAKSAEAKANKKPKGNQNNASTAKDKLLWLLCFVILAIAIGGNYYYTRYMVLDESSLMRLARVGAVIVTIAIGLALLLPTTSGKRLITYGRDSYTELRKVTWPTRQEALQTTLIVFVAVSIVSIFLYLADLVFLQLVRVITL